MLERIVQSERIAAACREVAAGGGVSLGGVWGGASAAIAASLHRNTGRQVVLVVGHLEQADNAVDDVELFTGETCGLLSAFEAQLATDHINEEVTGERIALLNQLIAGSAPGVLVAPILAMLQPVPTREALAAGTREIRVGEEISPEALCAWLVDAGYEQSDPVDLAGQFARRGGIVDIAISAIAGAVRIEFFGDEIDSIRQLDLDTQRSETRVESARLTALTISDSMAPGLAERTTIFTDYLADDAIVCLLEPTELMELSEKLYDRIRDDLVDDTSPVALRKVDDVFAAFDQFTRVGMQLFSGKSGERTVRMGVRSLERLAVNTAEALDELATLSADNAVWVYCENSAQEERFVETLDKHYPELAARVTLLRGRLSEGFYWPELKMVVVGHHEIYRRFSRVRKIRRVRAGRPVQSMMDLDEGDYVVHVGHGIAQFEGMRHLEKDGREDEYLRLKFAEGAVLHVPTSQIHLVQKYIGSRGNRPSLSHLGGGHWARTKERVAEAVKDLAEGMLKIQALRQGAKGFQYPRTTDLQRQFADEFPYTETEDQLAAIGQIDADMETSRPMDRLICGDVGFGKTEIAMRAALKTIEAGRQVAMLVPTTVLAEQHFSTFTERFADFPVSVACLSRFRSAKETTKILKQLQLGQVDILIGTHRILSKDVRFPDLGMVIIDEEQRFGVEHKERLKHLRAMVDVLTLSATPIPRTMHMALLGLRDISSLETPPMDRRSIHTEVVPKDDTLIRTAILRELNRDGQIYVVHNRVQTIDGVANHIRSLVGDARVDVAHGQMHEKALQSAMGRFSRRETDVLVSTTIIESGLDNPTANTMIIFESDRFGLAALHQLRGRVGRSDHRAYCYLLLPDRRSVNPVARKRLKAVEDFSDLGAGFQIAMRDLEIRGAGNILGPHQSGFIASVGYEMYCQLLETAVRQLRGDASPIPPTVHIELGIDATIPRRWIPAERQRMDAYRRLVLTGGCTELAEFRTDLIDAYGPIPPAAETLLEVAEVRILAGELGVESIYLHAPDIVFKIASHEKAMAIFENPQGPVRLIDDKTVHWRPPTNYLEMPTLLRVILRRLRKAVDG